MHATFYFTIFYYSAAIKATSKVLPHKPICQILCLPPLLLHNNLFVPPLMPPDPANKNTSGIKTFRWCPYSCSNSQKLICIRSIFILSVASLILLTQPLFLPLHLTGHAICCQKCHHCICLTDHVLPTKMPPNAFDWQVPQTATRNVTILIGCKVCQLPI